MRLNDTDGVWLGDGVGELVVVSVKFAARVAVVLALGLRDGVIVGLGVTGAVKLRVGLTVTDGLPDTVEVVLGVTGIGPSHTAPPGAAPRTTTGKLGAMNVHGNAPVDKEPQCVTTHSPAGVVAPSVLPVIRTPAG